MALEAGRAPGGAQLLQLAGFDGSAAVLFGPHGGVQPEERAVGLRLEEAFLQCGFLVEKGGIFEQDRPWIEELAAKPPGVPGHDPGDVFGIDARI